MKIKKETAVKILVAMLTILMLTICMQSTVFAGDGLMDLDNVKGTSSGAATSTQKIANQILGIVQVVAVSVAVIMLIVLAIKYISSAPNDKAEIKKNAIVYVVGAVLLFGATGILQIIKTLGESFGK